MLLLTNIHFKHSTISRLKRSGWWSKSGSFTLIEAHAREQGMSAEKRHSLRHELGPPILQGIKTRLDEQLPTLLAQSPFGKARKIDPWDYLRDLMRRLPAAKNHDVPDLVPARWKPLDSPSK